MSSRTSKEISEEQQEELERLFDQFKGSEINGNNQIVLHFQDVTNVFDFLTLRNLYDIGGILESDYVYGDPNRQSSFCDVGASCSLHILVK